MRALSEFAFRTLGLHRLEAACIPENGPSRKLLLKAGFADYPIVAYNLQQGRFPDVRLVTGYKPMVVGSVGIGGITLGGGVEYFFTRSLALDAALNVTTGSFTTFEVNVEEEDLDAGVRLFLGPGANERGVGDGGFLHTVHFRRSRCTTSPRGTGGRVVVRPRSSGAFPIPVTRRPMRHVLVETFRRPAGEPLLAQLAARFFAASASQSRAIAAVLSSVSRNDGSAAAARAAKSACASSARSSPARSSSCATRRTAATSS